MVRRRRTVRRVAPQPVHTSQWQAECAAINRQKGKQRWWMSFRRRCILVGSIMLVLHLAAGTWWVLHTGQIQSAYLAANLWFGDQTKLAGFEVRRIEIQGVKKIPPMLIAQAMDVKVGDPILSLSIRTLRDKVEELPEIRNARVERYLPDTLFVSVQEREGAALWQHAGKHQLIDWDGTVLANQEREHGRRYLVLVGEDAPRHAQIFLAMLKQTPELQGKVVAAKRVGKRRWDVTFSNDMVVKLPQDEPQKAWKHFAQMVSEQQLLDRAIQAIDMRIEDRLFIAIDPAQATPPASEVKPTLTSAHDT